MLTNQSYHSSTRNHTHDLTWERATHTHRWMRLMCCPSQLKIWLTHELSPFQLLLFATASMKPTILPCYCCVILCGNVPYAHTHLLLCTMHQRVETELAELIHSNYKLNEAQPNYNLMIGITSCSTWVGPYFELTGSVRVINHWRVVCKSDQDHEKHCL